jgi:hypothetical protein
LLHYSADGQRLGSSTLPVNIDASPGWGTNWPRVYATRSGSVFVTLGDQRIGLLDATLQLAWERDYRNRLAEPLPFDDGLLVEHVQEPVLGVSYVDLTGSIRWTVPDAMLYRDMVQVDEQDRAYFCDGKSLSVRSANGTEFVWTSFPEAKHYVLLSHARADRVLVRTDDTMICLNLAARRLWQIPAPGGHGLFEQGLVLSPDRYALQIEGNTNGSDSLIIVDGQGRVVHQMQNSLHWWLSLTDGTGFLAGYYDTDYKVTWGWFSAEGEQLWSYHPPQPTREASFERGDIVPRRESSSGPVLGPDGRIYFEMNSTLYVLDLQGHVVWQDPGTVYYDVWAQEMYIF